MEIEGRTDVVTGAASGIGAALARALHERGARVLLADLAEAVTDTAAQLGQPHWTGDVSTAAGSTICWPLRAANSAISISTSPMPGSLGLPESAAKTTGTASSTSTCGLTSALPSGSYPGGRPAGKGISSPPPRRRDCSHRSARPATR